ncbi:hypothetical protein Vi05172_g9310 [Venturia inaequalis]|nr:hypothetical protein Vi05172_g9310 [Venturia inaequalis]
MHIFTTVICITSGERRNRIFSQFRRKFLSCSVISLPQYAPGLGRQMKAKDLDDILQTSRVTQVERK